uniref:uncharacterized protein n=1 Tax=Myxine glutinosa TaxID=7769 RepID=UPI00358EB1F2
MKSYAELIAEWPLAVLVACTSIITICTLLAVLVPELPDFSDPLLGFEPRGTEISQRLVTWNNMVKNTGYMATLSNLPFRYAEQLARRRAQLHHHWPEDHERREVPAVNMEAAREENEVNGAGFVPWHANVEWDFRSDGFFCDAPDEKYPRLVFAAADGGSLWSVTALKSMCQIYERKVSIPQSRYVSAIHCMSISLIFPALLDTSATKVWWPKPINSTISQKVMDGFEQNLVDKLDGAKHYVVYHDISKSCGYLPKKSEKLWTSFDKMRWTNWFGDEIKPIQFRLRSNLSVGYKTNLFSLSLVEPVPCCSSSSSSKQQQVRIKGQGCIKLSIFIQLT